MARKKADWYPDGILLALCGALLLSGILILASVSASFSLQKTGTTFYYLSHQLFYGLLPGLAFAAVAFVIPLEKMCAWSVYLLLGSLLLMSLVFIPGIGTSSGGASRWISVGPITSFQPSEILKLACILYVASWLSSKGKYPSKQKAVASRNARRGEKKFTKIFSQLQHTFLPFIAIMSVIALFLLMQKNLSTLGVIVVVGLSMYFLSGAPFWHSLAMLFPGMILAGLAVLLTPFRMQRLAAFLNSSFDPLGQGYQAKQAIIGIGSGGLTGIGLGLSYQKFGLLPEPISDSIFAIFAEETGLIGALLLIGLYLAFSWRTFVIARRAPDQFSQLVAMGIGIWISFQAFVNMGSMAGVVPLTGIPLPFISYGGSSLALSIAALGVLLNISRTRKV